jgi:hypothetical protein
MSISYIFLLFTIISLWFPTHWNNKIPGKLKIWNYFLFFSLSFGLFYKRIDLSGLLIVFLLLIVFVLDDYRKFSKTFKYCLKGIILIIFLGLLGHLFSGFHGELFISERKLTICAIPYKKYLGFEKPIIAILILAFYHSLINNKIKIFFIIKKVLPIILLTFVTIIPLSLWMGYVKFDMKFIPLFFSWGMVNLLFTCTGEEAFFRGFVLKGFLSFFEEKKWGIVISLLLSSILFGMAHFQGGFHYMILSMIAGIYYGFAYIKTSHIESSILVHFSLNAVHFLFFTYPMLDK